MGRLLGTIDPITLPEARILPVNLQLRVQVCGWWYSRAWRGIARGVMRRGVMRRPSRTGPMSNQSCNGLLWEPRQHVIMKGRQGWARNWLGG
jgi:hypothetical protein